MNIKLLWSIFCAAAFIPALAQTPLETANKHVLRGDFDEALAIYQTLAAQGDAKAQYNLAITFLHQAALAKNAQNKEQSKALREEARAWLEKSATQNLPQAQLELGIMLLYGENGMINYESPAMWNRSEPDQQTRKRGIALITRAARQGLADAQARLGELWLIGWRVEEPRGDTAEAARWLEKAAKQNHAEAQYSLALLYLDDNGVTQNCEKVLYWLEKAGENGKYEGYGEISRLYSRGRCVTKDAQKAAEYEAKIKAAIRK